MKKSYELFQEIIARRGLSSYVVAMRSAVPESAFSLWKRKGVVPKFERMWRIAKTLSTPEEEVKPEWFYEADIRGEE